MSSLPIPLRPKPAPKGSPLGILSEFASHVEITEDFQPRATARLRYFLSLLQHRLLKKSGANSSLKSLYACQAKAIPAQKKLPNGEVVKTGSPGHVTVGDYSDSIDYDGNSGKLRYGFKWVRHCANPLLCFVCAPKIRSHRSYEIKAICSSMYEKGYRWLFVTFTAPHYEDIDSEAQIQKFQKAARKLKSGRWWENFKKKTGYVGQIRATELTVPIHLKGSTGDHWHHHNIMFFDRKGIAFTEEESIEINEMLSKRWVECLQSVGIECRTDWDDVEKFGLNVELPHSSDRGEKAAEYAAKGAAIELSPGIFTKGGRKQERVSHWEFMAYALLSGKKELQERALKIMTALKGRHWIHVSKEIIEISGIRLTDDEEIMRDDKKTENVFEFTKQQAEFGVEWWKINYYKMQRDVLEAAESGMDIETAIRKVCKGFHPLTGEDLYKARTTKNFLDLEMLQQSKPTEKVQ